MTTIEQFLAQYDKWEAESRDSLPSGLVKDSHKVEICENGDVYYFHYGAYPMVAHKAVIPWAESKHYCQ